MTTVLIVEDEILEQEFLMSIISSELDPKDKIFCTYSGKEAIDLAKKHRPDIIFMDLMLAELDGLSTIEEIRKFLPQSKVAILTAFSDFGHAQRAIRCNVCEYLLKPVQPKILKELVKKMLKDTPKDSLEENITSDEDYHQYIKEALKFIDENYKEKLTLEVVAAKVYMNPKYLSQVFKKEVGTAFTEYIVKLRINYACKLLETTSYPVYRISSESGFSDPSYFNRVFCSTMGMTPKAYRQKVLKE